MKVYSANEIRNIAVLGHSGCGKTTLMEAALHLTQVTSRMGRIEDGNTVSDYDSEEIKRKVSVSMSMVPVEWLNNKINFMDTPGYFDFAGEVCEALAAADAALILVSGKSGAEVGTEIAWENTQASNLPRIFFVNGIDDEHFDFAKIAADLKSRFGTSVVPFQYPFAENGKPAGFVDILSGKAYKYAGGRATACDMPGALADTIEEARAAIIEAVAETDEALMEKFFNDEPLSEEEITSGVAAGIRDGVITPVLCGSAVNETGVGALLDMLVNQLPPASELRAELEVTDTRNNEMIKIKCTENETLAAFVFKTIADPYVGRLSIFRVFSGTVKRDTPLYNVKQEIPEKAGHLCIIRGKEQIEVDEIKAGDIGAIAKLAGTSTQDTLCLKAMPVRVKDIAFPESLLSMAVMPKGKGDEDKMSNAFSKLLEEDKTLKFVINKETKQTVVSGIGDNQLDALVGKLSVRYKIAVDLVTPIIPYRETIKDKVRVQGKHKKQSGGHGQFGDVHMEFEPSGDRGKDYVFEEKVVGGAVPRQYFPAVEKGIQESVKAGPLAAYPVVGLKATLVFGSYHAVDSSEMAFKIATSIAFKDGFMKAKPTLLEPIARVSVTVPDEYTGDVMGDMNKRRGRILGMDKTGNKQTIAAEAPIAELQKYPTDLRSMTQGRGAFTMEFDRYEEAPSEVQVKVIEARKKELEALKEKE
ncbi:MAG: elongation factor G [Clostridiales bacterium]|jgi:elongation factor G|nr:elongation factor G [Clostridiales bacterium]